MALAAFVAAESADDRLFRLGEQTHVLQMTLHDRFYGKAVYQAQLRKNFAPSCAAHFLAFRVVEPKYASKFKPFVVQTMKSVVPADRLAGARRPLNQDPRLVAWTGRVRNGIRSRAAPLLAQATSDYDRAIARELSRATRLPLPPAEKADRSSITEPNLALACATYFGRNRDAIIAMAKGVSH